MVFLHILYGIGPAMGISLPGFINDFCRHWLIPTAVIVMWGLIFVPRLAVKHFSKELEKYSYEICPNCGYVLFKLPRKNVCPECGTNYDIEIVKENWKMKMCQ